MVRQALARPRLHRALLPLDGLAKHAPRWRGQVVAPASRSGITGPARGRTKPMSRRRLAALFAASILALLPFGAALAQTTLTIATVNNGDMVVMQRLSPQFEQQHPDIRLRWVVLEENVLRQRLTTDIAT